MAHLHVHNLFLWSMAVIYLFAFASLYHQLPGLYGDKGILPVASRELTKSPKLDWDDLLKHWNAKPTLLWVTQSLGIDVQTSMDVLALLGIGLASFAIITRFARNMLVFGALWLLYLSFYSVGNVFLWFQWDALLMEAGFLAFVFAPIPLFMPHRIHAKLAGLCMWPVKWLLFRLMFSSGILKLTGGCPTWWKLTALFHHYESQCIPTFLSWYIHQLPGWFDQLTLLHALFCEVVLPFFFFAPTKGLRKFAWYNQIILQLGIIATGNYNWFNLLTIVLSLSLLDDEDLGFKTHGKVQIISKLKKAVAFLFNLLIIGGVLAGIGVLYNIRYDEKNVLTFKPGFGEKEVHAVMEYAWPASVMLGLISLAWTLIYYFRQHDANESSFTKMYRGIFLGFYVLMALGLFGLSLIPYNTLSKTTSLGNTGVRIRQLNKNLEKFNLVSGYGLFRRMTGTEGRPELILEGSDDLEAGWKPYEFWYKPGKLDRPPPFLIPHQPRLDWQMWFAALSDQNSSPWVYNVAYRLLQAEPEVLRLIDPASPFFKKPPKYIRGQLYKYWFTSIHDKDAKTGNTTSDWWKRKLDREWLSPVSLEDARFMEIVTQQGVTKIPKQPKDNFKELHVWVKMVRDTTTTLSAPMFIWSLFMINVAFHRTLKALRL
ncbi:lipase maturation factor 2-like [Paramacrobiotus metropolitanus]|uniref:lipase maturation factor 2-like n=1 Tax=Paramacrobiotus metropolitanus TaxID=2943436 RepID=UPI002445C29A|nr:lipase maturation factor 2-like [Paramacrobiotus metropolitanus]